MRKSNVFLTSLFAVIWAAACNNSSVTNNLDAVSEDSVAAQNSWLSTDFGCSDKSGAAQQLSYPGCYLGFSSAKFDGFERRSLYVPVADGTRLAVDIYLPTLEGVVENRPLPTIFTYSRYWRATESPDGLVSTYVGKSPITERISSIEEALSRAKYGDVQGVGLLLAHGYAFVRAEARGTGASFGVRNGDMSGLEAADGREIIDWIEEQTWSDGKVAMIGQSYEGMSQYLVASTAPKALVAIMPGVATFDEYRASWTGGGVLRKYGLAWLAREARRDGTQEGKEGSSINPQDIAKREVARVDADPLGELREAARLERLNDPDARDPMVYFTRQSPEARVMVDILEEMAGTDNPAEIMEVIYSSKLLQDLMAAHPERADQLRELRFLRDASDMLMTAQDIGPNNLANLAPRIEAADIAVYNWGGWRDFASIDTLLWHANLDDPKKLMMGPWTHGPNEPDDPREDASYEFRRIEQLRWADYWLKGIENGIMGEPEITFAVMQADKEFSWDTAETLPILGNELSLYLNDGRLDQQLPTDATSATFEIDYLKTLGEQTRYHDAIGMGPVDIRDLETHAQGGAVAFSTGPLKERVFIAGSPVIDVFVTSNAKSAVLHGYLERVTVSGKTELLADGAIHSAHRVLTTPTYNNLNLPWSASTLEVVQNTPPLQATVPVQITFDLQPFAGIFEPGEEIRVVLTGAEANTNLVFPNAEPTAITIHQSAEFASRIHLPVSQSTGD
ncbi:MAG: CocE/NonD family hydrolase [Henriciella sp.]